MADESPQPLGDEEEAPPKTPFDNPLFLPVLLWIFTAWFGYDAFFNPEMEWVRFNRYGVGFVGLAAVYTTVQVYGQPRYLSAGLFLAYAVGLGFMGWLGSEGSWFNDIEAAVAFNRWGSAVCLALAAIAALRASRRSAAAS